jgi:hypothetical protein
MAPEIKKTPDFTPRPIAPRIKTIPGTNLLYEDNSFRNTGRENVRSTRPKQNFMQQGAGLLLDAATGGANTLLTTAGKGAQILTNAAQTYYNQFTGNK